MSNQKKIALCVLAKYPISGNVKTRLAKGIGNKNAVSLYKRLLFNTLDQLNKTPLKHKKIFIITADTSKNQISLKKIVKDEGHFMTVLSTSLNILIKNVFEQLKAKEYGKILVMCSDSPFITPELLISADEKLNNPKTLFISPSDDGGYSLIGLNNYVDIFSKITMSQNNVLSETLKLATKNGLNIELSSIINDIDTKEDLEKATRSLKKHEETKFITKKILKNYLKKTSC